MSKYKTLAISMRDIDSSENVFKTYDMIERAAFDEAKDYIERLIYSYYNPHAMDFDAVVLNAEKFLREVENEST